MNAAELVPSLQIFNGLSQDELDFIVKSLSYHRYDAGDVIAREGEVGSEMFVIAEGLCTVDVGAEDGGPPFVLAEIGPKGVVGEMALIDIKPRSATLRARTDVGLFAMTNQDFLRIWEWNPNTYTMVVLNVARELSRRLRRSNKMLSDCAQALRGGGYKT